MNSDTNTTTNSTDSELTVLVLATGLVKADKYIKSYSKIIKDIDQGLSGLEAMLDGTIETVLTRGSVELQEEMESSLDATIASSFFSWYMFINDTKETDNAGNVTVPGVRKDDQPKVPEDSFHNVDWGAVDDNRIKRAKSKAGAKNNHYLFSEYHDKYPNVDAVITVNDGSHRGVNEIRDCRGNNDWVSNTAGHVDQILDINVQDQILHCLNLLHHKRGFTTDQLHKSQIRELNEHLSEEELESNNIPTLNSTANHQSGTAVSAD